MRRAWVAALGLSLAVALPSASWAQAKKPAFTATAVKQSAFQKSATTITAAGLKDYLSFVASDEMEGRDTPSRGLDTTARFIATLLSRAGVKPGGDNGTYFQKIALKRQKLVPESAEFEVDGQKMSYGRDFLITGGAGSASGSLVFAGDGWFVKAKGIDAYKTIDPKGKIVVLTQGGLPRSFTISDLNSGKRGEDWIDPGAYAVKKGAVGIIILPPLTMLADPDRLEMMRRSAETGSYYVEKLPRGMTQAEVPTAMVTLKVARALFQREKPGADAILASFPSGTPVEPFALAADKKVRFSVKTTVEEAATQNVVGIVDGSDPALKSEYVALGAHYDHSGTRTTGPDTIMNGADDDGTGTVALLAMAEALAKAERRPKRSAVFVWHMGEEKGLWGAQYFVAFPAVPLDKIVAQLNIDMIGRSKAANDSNPSNEYLSGPNEVYVIGSKMLSTQLGEVNEAVNAAYLKLSLNYKYDDPKDPQRFFYRSDHYEYAKKNIPIVFYMTGVHADYHRPSDEVSTIDFAKFEKITRTIYATLWEIGEMKTRLKVDKQLPAEARQGIF